MNCQSCGMPMAKPEDHGGGDLNNSFCKYCTDEKGNLLPREQVKAKMIQFYVQKQSKTQEEAEKLTDQLMGSMPAWKGESGGAPTSAQPTGGGKPEMSKKPPVGGVAPTSPPSSSSGQEPVDSTVEPTGAKPATGPSKPAPTPTPPAGGGVSGAKPDLSKPASPAKPAAGGPAASVSSDEQKQSQ